MADKNLIFDIYNEDGTSFNGLSLKKSTFSTVMMSLNDKIEGDVYYKDNDLSFTFKEYILYKGIKYSLKVDAPPTIVKKGMQGDNNELKGMTKYSFTFYHPMVLLYNIPFTDISVSDIDSKYKSQDTTFYWIGTLTEMVAKLNKNLQGTPFTCALQSGFVDNGIRSDVIQFQDQKITDVLKTTYDTWEVPFVVDGYNILFGKPSNEIYIEGTTTPFVFKLGQNLGFKNGDRTPKNNTVVTRIAGYGSTDNIPNGYPIIQWTGDQSWKYTINNDSTAVNSYPIIDGVVNGASVKVINHPFTRKTLMPSVYVDCVNKKVNPLSTGYNKDIELIDYYDAIDDASHTYINHINTLSPSYYKKGFDGSDKTVSDIKPTIVGAKYNNQEIDIIKSISWINDDKTAAIGIDDTYNTKTEKYVQGYFKIEFYPLGFDLYAMAAATSAMSVNMTGGACNGCKFELAVDWDIVKTNFYYVDQDGNVIFDPTNIYGYAHRDYTKFPDSTNQSISIIVKKDTSTFGTIMPNIYQQPKTNDTFVFIGIAMPNTYITSAQTLLDEVMKQYMKENNIAYFDYPVEFDNYFLETNTYILNQINTNSIIRFNYATDTFALSVKEFSITWGDKALPTYNITLTDDITVVTNPIGSVADGLSKLGSQVVQLQSSYNVNIIDELSKRVSKIYDDTVKGVITFSETPIFSKNVNISGTLYSSLGEIENNFTVKGITTLQGNLVGKTAQFSDSLISPIINASTKVTSPLFVGSLQGNADTATKLQTARSIFNIPFDGLADCNGLFRNIINGDNTITFKSLVYPNSPYGIIGRSYPSGAFSLQAQRELDDTECFSLFLNPGGGNVGIGTMAPAYKLHVNGDIGATTAHFSNLSNGYIPYDTSNGLANSPIQTDGTKVGIGMSPIYGLDVAGTFRATADMFADGNIGTRNYVSQTTGWRVDNAGNSDFRKIYADELNVQAFTAQVSQALAGSDFLTKSVSKLSYNFVIPSSVGSSARLIVDDLEGFPGVQCFVNGDYIRLRPINKSAGLVVGNVYGTVVLDTTYGTNGFLNGTQAYTFTATSISNGAGLTVFKGSEVLDYGTSGNGLIKRTVLDSTGSPYMDIDTWSSDPSNSANYTTHVRLGNLAGVTNCSGYGLYSDNVFLTKSIVIGDLTKSGNYLSFDTTNGLQIKLGGNSVATTAGVSSSASSTLSAANSAAQGYATTAQANAANDATTKANNAIDSAKGYTDTQISIVNGNITSAISSVQIGGANLIEGTQDLSGLFKYGTLSQDDYLGFTSVSNNAPNSGYIDMLARYNISGLKLNQLYTLSFYAKSTVNGDAILSYFYPGLNGAGDDGGTLTTLTTEWKRYSITWNRLGNDAVNVLVTRLYNGRLTGTVSICGVKFEEGNKATSWSPAPQDVTNAISTAQSNAIAQSGTNAAVLYVTQTNYNSYVSQTDQAIAARVTTTTFNALGDRVTTAEGNISQNAHDITLKVSSTDYTGNTIASLINQSATTVKIQASQIYLDGAVTFSSLDSSTQGVINAKADISTVNQQVSNAISTAATDATNKVNAVQVGGTNLLIGSSFQYLNPPSNANFSIAQVNNIVSYEYTANGYHYTALADNGAVNSSMGILINSFNFGINVGDTICFSADVKGTFGTSNSGLCVMHATTDNSAFYAVVSPSTPHAATISNWTRKSRTYVIPSNIRIESDGSFNLWLFWGGGTGSSVNVYTRNTEIELGNKPSSTWSPAPEDVDSSISTAQQAAQTYATANCVQVGLSNAPDAIKNQVLAAAHGNFTFINGDSVYTGNLNANQVTAGYISADRIAASSITAGKIDTNSLTSDTAFINYVQTKIVTSTYVNTLSLSANAIVSGTINTNLLDAATIKSNIVNAAYISSLSITTGTLTVTGGSMLGALSVQSDGSLVNGSAFSLSSAGKLTCSNVDLTGKLTATSGQIGPFAISDYQLSASTNIGGNITDSLILDASIIRFLRGNESTSTYSAGVYIGGNVFPSSLGGFISCTSRFEESRNAAASDIYGNASMYIDCHGITGYENSDARTGNHAIWIESGHILGFRRKVRRLSSSTMLSKYDSHIIAVNNSGTITFTLPHGCEDGQEYHIKSSHFVSGNFAIAVEQGYFMSIYRSGNSTTTSITVNDGKGYTLVYDAVNLQWAMDISGY